MLAWNKCDVMRAYLPVLCGAASFGPGHMTVGRVNVFVGALALPLMVAPPAKSADHAPPGPSLQ